MMGQLGWIESDVAASCRLQLSPAAASSKLQFFPVGFSPRTHPVGSNLPAPSQGTSRWMCSCTQSSWEISNQTTPSSRESSMLSSRGSSKLSPRGSSRLPRHGPSAPPLHGSSVLSCFRPTLITGLQATRLRPARPNTSSSPVAPTPALVYLANKP